MTLASLPDESGADKLNGRIRRPLVGDAPYISIVIPTYKRTDRLIECLARLASCEDVGSVEVIVVEQNASIRQIRVPSSLESKFHHLKYIQLSLPNVSTARNQGALCAKGEVILFIDDDIELERGYLRNLNKLFKENKVDVVAGEYLDVFGENYYDYELKEVEWLSTGNIALRRDEFILIGGFDENLYRYNEDAELSHRLKLAGLTIATHGSLKAIHHHEPRGGTHSETSILDRTRAGMRNDLYFWHSIGGGLGTVLYVALRNLWGTALGNWKVKDRPVLLRLLVCCASLPDAMLYVFRAPKLIRPIQPTIRDRHRWVGSRENAMHQDMR